MATFPVLDGVEVFRLPPEGYIVDFAHPKQQKVLDHYLIFGIGGPLAFIALLQRYYTKIFLSKGLQVDDASIAQGGMCAHSWEMSLVHYQRYALISYIAAPVYMLCNGFTKLSLLTFYLHLSPQKWFRVSVWTSIVIVAIYTIVITFMMLFVCNPPRKAFDFKVEGTCTDAAILYMATAVSNIITDVMLFLLPIRMIYMLHMPKVQKFGAIVVFGIGSVTIATSIIRLVKLPVVLASTDPSWDAAPANIWTFIEANLFVICGSMPTLRKFFKHLMPRIMGSSGASKYSESYGAKQHSNTLSRVRKQRSAYAQFPEEDGTEMQRFSDENKDPAMTVHVSGSGDGDVQRDDHSDRAILRTQSFTVQYT
ncbi:hypothetical protein B0J13DRAFT_596808 [Dactylonectria estremocensis]|uniref:Rhodopsin domain-containing protein n=1 Tax=Dactylonectria estremocensis TaxID=1079267 RepID=A0A9P9J2L5_9HYPO|nr:hypothetical protein B0J13DRAFT_596808 [Dactylonectria estremocensis]